MLTHTTFIKNIEKSILENNRKEYVYIYYFDFVEFKLINHYYGISGGNILLGKVETYLKQLPQIVAYEHFFSDQFAFAVRTENIHSDINLVTSYSQLFSPFLSELQNEYAKCNLQTYCGVCLVEENEVAKALENASMAWRKAKERRTPGITVYSAAMKAEMLQIYEIERIATMALQRNDFAFFLQPKVELRTGKVVGAEALMRYIDGKNGVSPEQFLAVMEKNGSVIELDRLILRKTCEYMQKRMAVAGSVVCTSINISRMHAEFPDAVQQLHAITQEYQIPAKLIQFELTETFSTDQLSGVKALCSQLSDLGYSIAIDDFGAGYAGINVIQELKFDVLKLDRKILVSEEPLRKKNETIMPGIVHMLQKLGAISLCEGVETEEQCRYLMRIGCDQAQGFYFSKPVPPDQFYEAYDRNAGHYQVPKIC